MDLLARYETRHSPHRFTPGYEVRGLCDLFEAPDGTVAAHPDKPDMTFTLGTDEQGRYVTAENKHSAYVATIRQAGFPTVADHAFPGGALVITHSPLDTDPS